MGERFSDHPGRLCVMGRLIPEDPRSPGRQSDLPLPVAVQLHGTVLSGMVSAHWRGAATASTSGT